MKFIRERIPDDVSDAIPTSLFTRLPGMVVNASKPGWWAINGDENAYLIGLGRIGQGLRGKCYAMCHAGQILRFYAQMDMSKSKGLDTFYDVYFEYVISADGTMVDGAEKTEIESKILPMIAPALSAYVSDPATPASVSISVKSK